MAYSCGDGMVVMVWPIAVGMVWPMLLVLSVVFFVFIYSGKLPTPFDNSVPSSSLGIPSNFGSPGGLGTPDGPPPPIPARMNTLEAAPPPKPPRDRGEHEEPPPLPAR